MDDNVGNAIEGTWELCLDTDSVVFFGWEGAGPFPFDGEWYQIYSECTQIIP